MTKERKTRKVIKLSSTKLSEQWHPTKNGNLSPADFNIGSHQKVWWKCPKGEDHEWDAVVESRTKGGSGCPVCQNLKIVQSNCLLTINPALASFWHPTKNNNLTPENVGAGSPKKAWWRCSNNHEWFAPIREDRKCFACQSLKHTNPELAKEWHPTKNGNLTPEKILPKSGKKIWWQCKKVESHQWSAVVASRSKGSGCAICSGHLVVDSNSLFTINPKLASQWHPIRNKTLTPKDVLVTSHKKAWWQCAENKQHEWQASVYGRNITKGDCPFCMSYRASESNCLAKTHPELSKEWDFTKNGDLTPSDLVAGSGKDVWWKCPEGEDHSWKASVEKRSKLGQGCPVCANLKIVSSNSLVTTHPGIAAQWHPTKNGLLSPNDFHIGSKKQIWWKCSKGEDHVWKTSVISRKIGSGCQICINRQVALSNSLFTSNPELSAEWHPTKNSKLTAVEVTSGSNRIVWWKCSKDENHEWKAQILLRTNGGMTCPFCSSLECMNPEVAKEWHPTRNKLLTPALIHAGSEQKVWWQCKEHTEHIWHANIANRIRKGAGCPICAKGKNVSEKKMLSLIKEIFPDKEVMYRHKPKWLNRLELDVYIPELKIAFEHQGQQHFEPIKFFGGEESYKALVERDRIKKEICDDRKIALIYVNYNEKLSLSLINEKLSSLAI